MARAWGSCPGSGRPCARCSWRVGPRAARCFGFPAALQPRCTSSAAPALNARRPAATRRPGDDSIEASLGSAGWQLPVLAAAALLTSSYFAAASVGSNAAAVALTLLLRSYFFVHELGANPLFLLKVGGPPRGQLDGAVIRLLLALISSWRLPARLLAAGWRNGLPAWAAGDCRASCCSGIGRRSAAASAPLPPPAARRRAPRTGGSWRCAPASRRLCTWPGPPPLRTACCACCRSCRTWRRCCTPPGASTS